MSRTVRMAPGGYVYHVFNRAIARVQLFGTEGDYWAFEDVVTDAVRRSPIRICAYCVMPNHWHLLLWPEVDGQLAQFMQRMTLAHVRRWQEHRELVGMGHLYQGRYRAFVVQNDEHFLSVARYIERNALRANLVERAEDWQWSSLWRRWRGGPAGCELLSHWPLPVPADWVRRVNAPETEEELAALRRSVRQGVPYGASSWQEEVARKLGLSLIARPRGRPRK